MGSDEKEPKRTSQVRRIYWLGPLTGKDADIAKSVSLTEHLIHTVAEWQRERPADDPSSSDAVLVVGIINFLRVAGERIYAMQQQLPEAVRPTRAQFLSWLGEQIADQFEDLADGQVVEQPVMPGEES